MTIEQALGLEPDSAALHRLEMLWPQWAQVDPRIAVTSFEGIREFQRCGDPDQLRALISALAAMATIDGADDPDAASALAFVLIPGAVMVACGLREWVKHAHLVWSRESERLDCLVASELWRVIREFPAHRLENVVGNVLARTKYACRLQLGDRVQLRRAHSVWASTSLVEDARTMENLLYREAEDAISSTTRRVRDAIEDAIDAGLIRAGEADLLMEVSERVGDYGYNLVRGAGGMTSHQVAAEFAAVEGVSTSTMRRRIQGTLNTLRASSDPIGDAA